MSSVYVVSNTQQMSLKRFVFFYLQMFHLVTVAYEMSKTVKDWHFKTGFSDRPGVNRTVKPWQRDRKTHASSVQSGNILQNRSDYKI